jgi:hypothetical protein
MLRTHTGIIIHVCYAISNELQKMRLESRQKSTSSESSVVLCAEAEVHKRCTEHGPLCARPFADKFGEVAICTPYIIELHVTCHCDANPPLCSHSSAPTTHIT